MRELLEAVQAAIIRAYGARVTITLLFARPGQVKQIDVRVVAP